MKNQGHERRNHASIVFGLLASLAMHVGIALYILWASTTPDIGVDFELPDEIEFGLAESIEAPIGAANSNESSALPTEDPTTPSEDETEVAADAAVANVDAGVPSEPLVEDAGMPVASESTDDSSIASDPTSTSRIPPGAQIAVRLDMRAVRASPLAGDLRRLLANNADWHALLGGSGIDPVDSLEQIMLASPNLQRSRWVIAGKHAANVDVETIVAALAAANGGRARWHTRHGVRVADWESPDPTERVIAIIGPQHFSITRPQDLPRLLAVAAVRRQRDQSGSAADALLALQDGEALSFEVEGARNFVAMGSPELIPTRVRASLRESDGRIVVEGVGHFDSATQAEAARDHWEAIRSSYARHPLVALSGMSTAVRQAELTLDGTVVRFETALTYGQMRFLLSYVEGALRGMRR